MVGVVVPHALFAQGGTGPRPSGHGGRLLEYRSLGKLGGQQPGKGSEEQGERAVLCALRLDPKLRGTKTRVLRMLSQLSSLRAVRHRHRTDFAVINYTMTTFMTTQ